MRFALPLTLALWATTAPAQTTSDNGLARDGLAKTIVLLSQAGAPHGFEIGMLQTLRAVEKTLQVRYEYGLGDSITGLPLLRLSTGDLRNSSPKPSTPGTLSDIVDGFVDDMAVARATLEDSEAAGVVPFEMNLQDIWFDINANGKREDTESVINSLGPVVLGRRAYREFVAPDTDRAPLIIRFDEADHAWLLAYTHMLSGFGNLYMAFDPEPVLRDLAEKRAALANVPDIPNYYDPGELLVEIAALEAEATDIKQQRGAISERIKPYSIQIQKLSTEQRESEDEAQKALLQTQIEDFRLNLKPLEDKQQQLWQASRLIRNEIAAAKAKLPVEPGQLQMMGAQVQPSIDIIYVAITALAQNPDAARIRAAHDDWRAMITHNRNFWALLAAETDNDREWIPNPSQTSAMPLSVPSELAEGWQDILVDIEAVLEGRLLIHHPLLPQGYGISVPAYVDDPAPLDLVGWIHGIAAYRYAAKGPRLTSQSWQAFQRLASGNAGGFALFFN